MSTIRAANADGGAQRRSEQTRRLWTLLRATIRGGFLLPKDYVACEHEWRCLDSGYAVCVWCGKEHWCGQGGCPEVVSDHERVCAISGCVTLENELRAERDAHTRVGPSLAAARKSLPTPVALKVSELLRSGAIDGEYVRDMVEATVREVLMSDKTQRCMEQELRRNHAKEVAVFSRLLRETAHDRECRRPNMVVLLGQVRFHCRKNRQVLWLRQHGDDVAEAVVRRCTEAIAGLILVHGGPRIARIIQNAGRYREFITSMLFLMRAGISFQGRQVLPRMEILHDVLPLQVLLCPVFSIRAKAITEGLRRLALVCVGLRRLA